MPRSLAGSPVSPAESSFFFNDTATTEIYTLSLHDALPICSATSRGSWRSHTCTASEAEPTDSQREVTQVSVRSEEHTSELQSLRHLVCRLLLEKKNKKTEISAPAL